MAETQQFLYILRPTRLEMLTIGPTVEEQAIVSQHFAYLQDLTQKGVAILVGRTQTADEDTVGIVVFKASSEEAARELMENDPTVKRGVMQATLYPFRVALMTEDPANVLLA